MSNRPFLMPINMNSLSNFPPDTMTLYEYVLLPDIQVEKNMWLLCNSMKKMKTNQLKGGFALAPLEPVMSDAVRM
jgi:hypothetical protein